jgi:preprotein translocase subunit SecG
MVTGLQDKASEIAMDFTHDSGVTPASNSGREIDPEAGTNVGGQIDAALDVTAGKSKESSTAKNANQNGDVSVSRSQRSSNKSVSPHQIKNGDFMDVEETGKWGHISRKEVMFVVAIVCIVLLAIIVVVVMFATKGAGGGSGGMNGGPTQNSSLAPTVAPLISLDKFPTPLDKYTALLNALKTDPLTTNIVLPPLLNDLRTISKNSKDPVTLAADWLLFNDPTNSKSQMLDRFSLASVYFALTGWYWTEKKNWLSGTDHVCNWQRVTCFESSTEKRVTEVDLSKNNLVGTIPKTLSLLKTVQTLWFNSNSIKGSIPGEVFGSLPQLTVLYLQNNQLNGTVPVSLRNNGVLGKLIDRYYIACDNISSNILRSCRLTLSLQERSICRATTCKEPGRNRFAHRTLPVLRSLSSSDSTAPRLQTAPAAKPIPTVLFKRRRSKYSASRGMLEWGRWFLKLPKQTKCYLSLHLSIIRCKY